MGDLWELEWDRQARGYDDTEGERICLRCVLDGQLRENLSGGAEDTGDPCAGCGRYGRTAAGDDVLAEMMEAVHVLYSDALGFMPTDGSHYAFDDMITDGQDVMDDEFGGDLEDDAYAALRPYVRLDVDLARDLDASDDLDIWWHRLRESLAGTATPTGLDAQFLDSFEGLLSRNRDLLRAMPAGTSYWRVRRLEDGKDLCDYNAAQHMGSPPPDKAWDNRFSREKESAFYGADAAATAIAEIFRGKPGTAVQARFLSTKSLTLLDLVALPPSPSIYDKPARELYLILRFLKQFAEDVSQPVDRDAGEDYRLTQTITDVVRRLGSPPVDGIRYTSSLDGNPSVIIFAGPENCADPGAATAATILEYDPDSLEAVTVV